MIARGDIRPLELYKFIISSKTIYNTVNQQDIVKSIHREMQRLSTLVRRARDILDRPELHRLQHLLGRDIIKLWSVSNLSRSHFYDYLLDVYDSWDQVKNKTNLYSLVYNLNKFYSIEEGAREELEHISDIWNSGDKYSQWRFSLDHDMYGKSVYGERLLLDCFGIHKRKHFIC
jgi:hypothetical protein